MDYFREQINALYTLIFLCYIYSINLSIARGLTDNEDPLINLSDFHNNDNLTLDIQGDENDTSNGIHLMKRRELIFPGTLWCGLGNVAVFDDDIGFFSYTDICCKNHDKCRLDVSYMHKTKVVGILDFFFNRDTICPCDSAFYVCLRKANTFISNAVGKLFFNILRPTCLTLDHPILSCSKYQGKLVRWRCLEYELNTSAPMTIYRKDNPYFN